MEWIVESPARLDAFLVDHIDGTSRAQVQKLIKEGSVSVNGKKITKPAQQLAVGSSITFQSSKLKARGLTPEIHPSDLSLPVLYEDDSCFVINKPAGYAVHPATSTGDEITILHGIAFIFAQMSLPFSSEAVLVHRLDKETTGCLLVAKNADAHHVLQKQFEDRTVKKAYLAIVAGVPIPSEALIDAPIGRNLTDRTRMSVLRTSVSREAKTAYRTLSHADDVALLECDLLTGRTHQIRVHLCSIDYPILGDPTYYSSKSMEVSERYNVSNLCLHSWKLSFSSPSGDLVNVQAPLPSSLTEVLQAANLSVPSEKK